MDGAFVHILLGGRRIQISPDFNNTAYAAIQIEHTGKGTVQGNGRAICQHVAVLGGELASRIRLAKFSAMSDDKTRLYVPVKDGLLQISKAGILGVANGANPDSIWLEHPNKIPFQFLSDCEVREPSPLEFNYENLSDSRHFAFRELVCGIETDGTIWNNDKVRS